MSPREIAAAVAAVVAVAVALRRRGLERHLRIALLVVAALLGLYASGLTGKLPDPKTAIEDVAAALGQWTYAVVGAFAFLETGAFVGLVAPGETVVMAGGVIAGQGEIELLPLIGLVWVCAVLGDTTSFLLGRRLGRRFLERHGSKLLITSDRLGRVEGYFDRHGGKTILIGRFIGLVRALAPFLAGSSGLAYRRFLPFSVVGTGLWASTFTVLGYIFWQSFDKAAHIAGQALLAFSVIVGAVVAVVVAYRRLRDPAVRRRLTARLDRLERRRYARPPVRAARATGRRVVLPAWRALAPELRFLWQRLTPGGLGLELTTALAVAAVGVYAFVLLTATVSDQPDPAPLDRQAFDLGHQLFNQTAVDVAKTVSELGALPITASLIAVVGGVLLARGHTREAGVLAGGFVLAWAGYHLTKVAVDRPRPALPLVQTSGSSFPSGHATQSVAWLAVAVVSLRRLGLTGGVVLAGGLVMTAVIGLSRVYLRAHYLSDVLAGWALALAVYGLLAVVTLVVEHMRQNSSDRSREARARP